MTRRKRIVWFGVVIVATIAIVAALAPLSRKWLPLGPAASPSPSDQTQTPAPPP